MTGDVHRICPFVPKAVLFSVLYILVIAAIIMITYRVVPMMLKHIPELSNQLQVQIVKELKEASQKWNLQAYVDVDELRGSILKASTTILQFLATSLTPLYKGFIQFVFALAINLFFYSESEKVEQAFTRNPDSLMTFLFKFMQMRLRVFYVYFRRVMGGQVLIALINTLISSVVIFATASSSSIPDDFCGSFLRTFPCGGKSDVQQRSYDKCVRSDRNGGNVNLPGPACWRSQTGVHSKFQNNRRNRASADSRFSGRADFL